MSNECAGPKYGNWVIAESEDKRNQRRAGKLDQAFKKMAMAEVDSIENAQRKGGFFIRGGIGQHLAKAHSGLASFGTEVFMIIS